MTDVVKRPAAGGGPGLELDPHLTFDTLAVGPANRLAVAAARRVAEAPARAYNPVYIYGASGVGKTHLLTAIGHHARHLHPGIAVVYATLEVLVEGVLSARESGAWPEYAQRLSRTRVLLLDDVQFLSDRPDLQEALIRAWNLLPSRRAQVVVASDRAPTELQGLGRRLATRLSSSLVVEIETPDPSMRLSIARLEAARRGSPIGEAAAGALARFPFPSVRELQGAVTRILALQELEGRTIREDDLTVPLRPLSAADSHAAETRAAAVATASARAAGGRAGAAGKTATRAPESGQGVGDPWFLSREKIVWDWDPADVIVEELD